MRQFDHLMSPLSIGSLLIPNRIVFPAVHTGYVDPDGGISPKMSHFYGELARGGAGLIIVGATGVSSQGKFFAETPCIDDDLVTEGLAAVFRSIHNYGAGAAIQLAHGGRQNRAALQGHPIVAPSPLPWPATGVVPRQLAIDEIEVIEDQFAEGTARAREAGADMVQFHAAHGYLIHQFLSPRSNQRTDAYGGNLENRMRFLLNIVRKTRKRVGKDFPLSCRINGNDYQEGGLNFDEALKIAGALTDNGVQFLDVSGGVSGAEEARVQAMTTGDFRRMAREIREATRTLVSCVGMITDLGTADQIVREGAADTVSMARALIADPELIKKTLQGDFKAINACTRCNTCRYWLSGKPYLTCSVYGRW